MDDADAATRDALRRGQPGLRGAVRPRLPDPRRRAARPEEMLAELRRRLGNDEDDRAGRGDRAAGADHRAAGEGARVVSVSTHVLDSVAGRPAAGIAVRLFAGEDLLAEGVTDRDGRCRLTEDATGVGTHRLVFATGPVVRRAGPRRLLSGGRADLRRPGAGRAPPRAAAAGPVRLLDLPRQLTPEVPRATVPRHGDRARAEPVRKGGGPRRRGRPQRAAAHAGRPQCQLEPARRLRRRAHRRRQRPRAGHGHAEEHRVRLRPRRRRHARGVRPAAGPALRRLLRLDHRRAGGGGVLRLGADRRRRRRARPRLPPGRRARCGRRW